LLKKGSTKLKTIHIVSRTLPDAWYQALLACWTHGQSFPTEYDKPGDPQSLDITVMIHVKKPMAEPRIHRCLPCGLDMLEKYRSELLYGVHDHWVDPKAGKWKCTYHQRYFQYDVPTLPPIDQIFGKNGVVEILKQTPHSRRAQIVTWQPWSDLNIVDPPCPQSLWFRCQKHPCLFCSGATCEYCNSTRRIPYLHMTARMRSNDAYKAAFMDMFANIEIQRLVAKALNVKMGEYIHYADSFHIYGSYFKEVSKTLRTIATRKREENTYTTAMAIPFFIDGCNDLLAEPDMPADKKQLVQTRLQALTQGMQNGNLCV